MSQTSFQIEMQEVIAEGGDVVTSNNNEDAPDQGFQGGGDQEGPKEQSVHS